MIGLENISDYPYITIENVSIGSYQKLNETESEWNVSTDFKIRAFVYIPRYQIEAMIIIITVLGSIILSTILGNVFVIAAIIIEKSLQGVSNYLILSLAVTDLMVAVLVMPISVVNQISVFWYLGSEICDMWISMDVLCCTASILHLVVISFDRYWAVSNIDYIRKRNARQISLMIVIVWVVSVLISVTPLLGWEDSSNKLEDIGKCIISQNKIYTIFSTVGAFYCPMVLMLILNFKIYKAARSRIRKRHFSSNLTRQVPCVTITNVDGPSHRHSSGSEVSQDGFTVYNASSTHMTDIEPNDVFTEEQPKCTGNTLKATPVNFLTVPTLYSINKPLASTRKKSTSTFEPEFVVVPAVTKTAKSSDSEINVAAPQTDDSSGALLRTNENKEKLRKARLEMKRERKAARVLGIITGAFIACWLPFFILAVTVPFCGKSCKIPPQVFSVFLWLGYFNSLLNPIIYTIFNPSFRDAFNKIFLKKTRRPK